MATLARVMMGVTLVGSLAVGAVVGVLYILQADELNKKKKAEAARKAEEEGPLAAVLLPKNLDMAKVSAALAAAKAAAGEDGEKWWENKMVTRSLAIPFGYPSDPSYLTWSSPGVVKDSPLTYDAMHVVDTNTVWEYNDFPIGTNLPEAVDGELMLFSAHEGFFYLAEDVRRPRWKMYMDDRATLYVDGEFAASTAPEPIVYEPDPPPEGTVMKAGLHFFSLRLMNAQGGGAVFFVQLLGEGEGGVLNDIKVDLRQGGHALFPFRQSQLGSLPVSA